MKIKKNPAKIFIGSLLTSNLLLPLPEMPFMPVHLSSTLYAGTTISKDINVSTNVNVPSNCNFTGPAINLAFGDYDTVGTQSTVNKDSSVSFTFRCNKGGSAFLALDYGDHANGSTRRMQANGQYLTYELYQDASRSTVWSNGANVKTYISTGAAPVSFTVYGRIPAGQDVSANTYNDTITITATF